MKRKSNLFLFFAILLTLPAIFGILHKGFFLSDDGNWMVIRFSAFYETLRSGQFPVRFLSRLNNGYGYPVADFLYPLFMYIGVPIHLLKINFVDSVKIIFAAGFVLSSVFSFLWLRKLFSNFASLTGSLAYAYFPYHLWDVYKRGSVGEALALSIVPFILWAIELGNLPLAALGYGLLILAHNSLALMFIPILFIYQLLKGNTHKTMKSLKAIELGLLISCFFWLPALYDKQFTVFDKVSVADFTNYFVSDLWLFGLTTLTAILGSIFLLKQKDKKVLFFFVVAITASFLSISASRIVWEHMPFISLIQFPFRVMSVLTLCVSFLIASQIEKSKFNVKIMSLAFLILIVISSWKFLTPSSYQYYPDSFYSTNQDSTTVKNEYMPKWVKSLPAAYSAKVINTSGHERLDIKKVSPSSIELGGDFVKTEILQVNTIYYPGWQVFVDGKNAAIDYNSNGLIRFPVPSGSHTIVSEFGETPISILADIISLSGLILLLVLFKKSARTLHDKKYY